MTDLEARWIKIAEELTEYINDKTGSGHDGHSLPWDTADRIAQQLQEAFEAGMAEQRRKDEEKRHGTSF